jgi:uncharacterized protein YlbG (UPF0298 family)
MVESSNGFSKTCYYEILQVDRKADEKTIDRVRTFQFLKHLRPTKKQR